jgi:hypothetical protein
MQAARDLSYRLRVLLFDLIGGFKLYGMKAACDVTIRASRRRRLTLRRTHLRLIDGYAV